jgi:glutamate synthase (NADPH) small chain
LAAAQQLARAGHETTVFEKDEKAGGMLRYGIPDFKLGKGIIDRRLKQLSGEGVIFQNGINVGSDISAHYLRRMFDAICLCKGARETRDLPVPGRNLKNIMFALDYLGAQNRLCSGELLPNASLPNAKDKTVVVLGGGDTGSDCVGTARRQGAKQIYQFEILPKPPEDRPQDTPWPMWPRIMRTSSSHEEGCERRWSVQTRGFEGNGRVRQVNACEVEWARQPDGGWKVKELPGTEFTVEADLVLLALGFLHVTHGGLVKDLGLQLDPKGNLMAPNYQTSEPWVFAAGDTVSGASLVVRAIESGRQAAAAMDRWLRME